MKPVSLVLQSVFAASITTLGLAAAPVSAAQDDAAIRAQYDQAMKRCDALKGNEKDVCEKEAKAQRESAKADAKEAKESAEAHQEAVEDKRDAQYKVAKEKCDAMSGDAKDACLAEAKTKYGQ